MTIYPTNVEGRKKALAFSCNSKVHAGDSPQTRILPLSVYQVPHPDFCPDTTSYLGPGAAHFI